MTADQVTLTLTEYEAVNLREALAACQTYTEAERSPLFVLNNGDWLGQIWQQLNRVVGPTTYSPNQTKEELRERARRWTST